MAERANVLISLVVPTRGRVEKLRQFLDSLIATTAEPNRVEVILVVDQDDPHTLSFRHSVMPCKMIVVPPGQTMGALNRAGYAAAGGDFIMLLNDDVIVRTQAWDEKILEVFRAYPDGIVLVHVNDLIFQDKLCTFPFVTRAYCEFAGGICPEDYVRYRIDDHIYNVFNLLAVLGRKRIVFLPEIVFEHTNTGAGIGTDRYVPIPEIHAADTKHFDRLLASRKALAVNLAETIDRHLFSQLADTRRKVLDPIEDSVALRRPEFVTIRQEDTPLASHNTRVTIGVVSADVRSEHARTCIDHIKRHTNNYDLIVLDNNFGPGFNHSREMNRLRSICRTDFLVLMDDDVFVEPGWLDGLLRCVTPQIGVVTPLHMDRDRMLSYAGVVMSPDRTGRHTHSLRMLEKPEPVQTLCSAVMLIDMTKCGHICIDESYTKYFLDIDYGLRIWESGFQVVVSPYSKVTHIGGATLQQGSDVSKGLFEIQLAHFAREWIANGRYQRLETCVWRNVPEISKILALPKELELALHTCFEDLNVVGFRENVSQLLLDVEPVPALKQWVNNYLFNFLQNRQAAVAPAVQTEFEWLRKLFLDNVSKASAEHSFQSPIQKLFRMLQRERERFGGWWPSGKIIAKRAVRSIIILVFGYEAFQLVKAHRRERARLGGWWPLSKAVAKRTIRHIVVSVFGYGNFQRLKTLRNERERLGGWWPFCEIVTKRAIRFTIISLFGHETFQIWKNRWRGNSPIPIEIPGNDKRSPESRFQVIKNSDSETSERYTVVREDSVNLGKGGEADSMRWIESSPQIELKQHYRGHKIYRYEFKFFGIPSDGPDFRYDDFLAGKYGEGALMAHSVAELRAAIDRNRQSTKGQSVLIMPFPTSVHNPENRHTVALVTSGYKGDPGAASILRVNAPDLFAWARELCEEELRELKGRLRVQGVDRAVIPWRYPESWRDSSLEGLASRLVEVVDILQPEGFVRTYDGENLHRLIYNKAYLCSMFSVIPPPTGKKVLEVGCSDGLVCDIFSRLGAAHVTGIDVMRTVGCGFRDPQITYRTMDATNIDFPDQSFDISYSIATFEHLPDPRKTLSEMLRVTKVGGYCYVQAAPLYHSPFGHHMFAYFQDYPWIHLRKTPSEMLDYMKQRGIDRQIEEDYSISCEAYLAEMLTRDHVNGLFLQDFRLDEFAARPDVEVLRLNFSFEGRELLNAEILSEIQKVHPDRLVEHGFEIAFRRVA